MDNWLIQSIVGSWAWWLLGFVGGGIMTYLQLSQYKYLVPPILVGLVTLVLLLLVIWFVQENYSRMLKSSPTTAENIDGRIRMWLDEYNVQSRRVSGETNEVFFQFDVVMKSGVNVTIARVKGRPRLLQFQARLSLSDKHQELVRGLSPLQMEELVHSIRYALASASIGNGMELPKSMTLFVTVPIAGDLNEDTVMAALDRTDFALVTADSAFALAMLRLTPQKILEIKK